MLEKEKKRDKLNKPMWIFALYPFLPGGIKEIQIRDLGSPLDPVAKWSQIGLSILRIFSFKEDPRDYRPYTSWHPTVEDWCWNQLLMTTTNLICFHKKQQDIKKHFRLAEKCEWPLLISQWDTFQAIDWIFVASTNWGLIDFF